MKLALIGHGSMGKLVEARAVASRHEIGSILTSADGARDLDEFAGQLQNHDAAIDFSVGNAVLNNVTACARAGIPLVEGTTGWNNQLDAVREIVDRSAGALVYGANFSIGVNLFYRIVDRAAELFASVQGYEPFIEEAHHSRKRDAPSGTALKLREIVAARIAADVSVASTRAGHIPGTHRVGFDSDADQILLTHTARSREGFAAGAILAARWVVGRTGVFEFTDVISEILNTRKVI